MKFGTLRIQNFLTIGEASIRLDDRGLVLIQGVNDDDSSAASNGAGKSSIVDALCWALFGETARGVAGDSVINRNAGKECQVAVNLHDDDGKTYAVVRHRKHKIGKNGVTLHCWIDPTNITDLTQGTDKLTQEKINEVLGCSYDVFCSAVYAGQDKMPDLPGMTDKQLKLLVEEAAGVTILEAAYEKARARVTAAKGEITAAQMGVTNAENAVASNQDHAELMRSSAADWQRQRKTAVEELMARASTQETELTSLRKQLLDLNAAKVEADLKQVTSKLAAVSGERDEEKRILAEQSAAERLVAGFRANLATLKARYEKEKAGVLAVGDRIGTACGECGKEYCAHDLTDAKRLATDRANATAREFNDLRKKTADAQNALESVTETLSRHRASMTDISAQTSLSDALNAKLREVEKLRQQIAAGERTHKQLLDRYKELSTEPNPFEKQIAAAEKRVEESNEHLAKAKASLEAKEAELMTLELVAKVFSPAGVRAHILDDVTPFLNEQTARYLGTLSDGNITATWTTLVKTAKGELKEKFSIEVTHAEGGESFDGISGGEKRKVRIATALALQDLVARRATKPIDLFIGDEIDNALDDAGLERLTAILEEKARERGSVILISHSDLKDWISNVITVTKRGKVSTVEEASV